MLRESRHLLLALGLLAALGSPVALAAQTNSVTWLLVDQAPQFILSGPDQGLGSQDLVLDYLRSRLPQYTHSTAVNNISRNMSLLKESDGYAAVGMVRTPERETLALISQPYTLVLPPGLLVRKAELARFQPFRNAQGGVELEALLKAGVVTLGVAAGRSYGPHADEILSKYKESGVLSPRFAEKGIMAGLVDMLAAGRIGAALVFRSEVRYVIRDEERLSSLVVLPLSPVAPPLTIHIMVPRTEWGRAFLLALDPMLVEARTQPEFRVRAERWTDDATRDMLHTALKTLNGP